MKTKIIMWGIILAAASLLNNINTQPRKGGSCSKGTCGPSRMDNRSRGGIVTLDALVKQSSNKRSNAHDVLQDTLDNHSDQLVLLDFYADWCSPCKDLLRDLPAISKAVPDAYIIKIDIDDYRSIANNYNVQGIPSLVLIKNGDTAKGIPYRGKQSLIQHLRSNLP